MEKCGASSLDVIIVSEIVDNVTERGREEIAREIERKEESYIFFVMKRELYSADRESKSVTLDVVIMSRWQKCSQLGRVTPLCRVPVKKRKKISPNQAAKS
eukprot:sb/3478526/